MLQQITGFKKNTMPATMPSRTMHIPDGARDWEKIRAASIEALRGRYRDMLTPSEEFARQKAEETLRE